MVIASLPRQRVINLLGLSFYTSSMRTASWDMRCAIN